MLRSSESGWFPDGQKMKKETDPRSRGVAGDTSWWIPPGRRPSEDLLRALSTRVGERARNVGRVRSYGASPTRLSNDLASEDSLSAVSTPNFATEYSFES